MGSILLKHTAVRDGIISTGFFPRGAMIMAPVDSRDFLHFNVNLFPARDWLIKLFGIRQQC